MDKIRVVVCDNCENEQEYYVKTCKDVGQKVGVEVKVKAYTSAQELLFDIEDKDFMGTIDILQIEIDMPGCDGIDIARQVRSFGYKNIIIFVTHSANYEYYENAFDIKAINYVRKGSEHRARLERVFIETIEAAKKLHQEHIVLRCAGERRRIDLAQIRYFEIFKYRMVCHYDEKESFEFVCTMAKLESELFGKGFVRIHRGYMVSLDHVESYKYDNITLVDGTNLPLGRTYSNSFKKAIEEWRQ